MSANLDANYVTDQFRGVAWGTVLVPFYDKAVYLLLTLLRQAERSVNTWRQGRGNPPIGAKYALFSGDCAGNQGREFGYGRAQDIEKPTQTTTAVGCLLLQSLYHEHLFLSEDFAQERLWVECSDIPRLQVLWSKVAKVQSHDY